jgi:hypothetical protein
LPFKFESYHFYFLVFLLREIPTKKGDIELELVKLDFPELDYKSLTIDVEILTIEDEIYFIFCSIDGSINVHRK